MVRAIPQSKFIKQNNIRKIEWMKVRIMLHLELVFDKKRKEIW
ncbi:hypothetical protein LEP1GSC108_2859 [Leptospira weilii str. UI 13098]|uniref:Uncharacterized protein n=1 Tax=Leptospira weilii str. UI 13098 TaxID=1088542 RepID=M6Q5H3_9LEPT|nr:hypothetical protein LEP1GSC108_2859 [Leptospira weilii str. UI 13098]